MCVIFFVYKWNPDWSARMLMLMMMNIEQNMYYICIVLQIKWSRLVWSDWWRRNGWTRSPLSILMRSLFFIIIIIVIIKILMRSLFSSLLSPSSLKPSNLQSRWGSFFIIIITIIIKSIIILNHDLSSPSPPYSS